eukprot:scaffold494_cov245-Pinguiococcus_pyrenoidosus.AAC.7
MRVLTVPAWLPPAKAGAFLACGCAVPDVLRGADLVVKGGGTSGGAGTIRFALGCFLGCSGLFATTTAACVTFSGRPALRTQRTSSMGSKLSSEGAESEPTLSSTSAAASSVARAAQAKGRSPRRRRGRPLPAPAPAWVAIPKASPSCLSVAVGPRRIDRTAPDSVRQSPGKDPDQCGGGLRRRSARRSAPRRWPPACTPGGIRSQCSTPSACRIALPAVARSCIHRGRTFGSAPQEVWAGAVPPTRPRRSAHACSPCSARGGHPARPRWR